MCGISGLISSAPLAQETLERMNSLQNHRGPDQDGLFCDANSNVYLGHKRLSILDLSEKGRQPMSSPCGRFTLVFNGEIYNHETLRSQLRQRGHSFRSTSDTEVLLIAFMEWGIECLNRFNGMFSFALYDQKDQCVYLARDRIGIKPLYFFKGNELFAFASEAKAFRALDFLGLDPELDTRQVQRFFGFNWLPDNQHTLIKGIQKIQPGEWLLFNAKTFKVEQRCLYWQLEEQSKYKYLDWDQALDLYDKLLNESVRLRMRADVPVGVMLSGGLDSSTIAAIAKQHTQRLHTFTLVFDHKNSEGEYARRVSQHIGSEHDELFIDTRNFMDTLRSSIGYFDDLNSTDAGLLSTRMMSRILAERGIKVVLLGEGSDEINGGYSKFAFSKFPFNWIPAFLRDTAFYFAMSRFPPWRKGFLSHARYSHKQIGAFRGDIFQQHTRYDVLYQLPNHLLMKVDKGTMAQSVEARVPFLDHNLVEFIFSIPTRYKLAGSYFSPWKVHDKYILRKLSQRYLPPEISWRKKFGMMLPVSDVLKNNRNEILEELRESPNSRLYDFVSRKEILELFDPPGKFDLDGKDWLLWKAFLFHLWTQSFFRGHECKL